MNEFNFHFHLKQSFDIFWGTVRCIFTSITYYSLLKPVENVRFIQLNLHHIFNFTAKFMEKIQT